MEMTKYKLGDLCRIASAKRIFENEYVDFGVPFVRGQEISDGSLLDQNSVFDCYISKERYEEIKQKYGKPSKGDILITAVGTIGNLCYLDKDIDFYFKDGNVIWFSDIKDFCCGLYLYHFMKGSFFKDQLKYYMIGAVQNALTMDMLKKVNVPLPSLSEQKKIAAVLSALDDKIALNKKMNQKLEAMAKRLYDYWFVQFDFPDENGRPYKTSGGPMTHNPTLNREIPVGWEVLTIGEILDKYKTTKKFNTSDYKSDGKYPIVDQDTSTFIAGYTDDEDVLKRYPAVLFGDHSTCVKFLNFEFGRGADGTQILYSKDERVRQFYLYMAIKSMSIPNPGYARHFKFLKEMPIILPCQELADEYQKRMEPIYTAITKVDLENRAMTKLRNKLLPLLMNGQVTIA
ncbi:restriction endonuclease subunit S [Fibrobacter sp. UWH9]|uniref:restriction endonuclease subunit S n=1 Tax=Fibrobacter sp. UWH9 TaxID=1896213 RepID=UPI0009F93040|nr:restriction endonuclease subunit S [Fibrobacter sp. UWH9]